MTEREKMLHAKSYIDMLAEGRSPLTGAELQRDSTLSDARIVRCLFYVSELIQRLAVACDEDGHLLGGKRERRPKAADLMTPERLAQVPLSDAPVPITVFCRHIAEWIDPEHPPRLSTQWITTWLAEAGYLRVIEQHGINEGKTEKVSTEQGERAGITTVDSILANGQPIHKNLYDRSAQQLILDHLPEILAAHR